jgi:hypothetical protein
MVKHHFMHMNKYLVVCIQLFSVRHYISVDDYFYLDVNIHYILGQMMMQVVFLCYLFVMVWLYKTGIYHVYKRLNMSTNICRVFVII